MKRMLQISQNTWESSVPTLTIDNGKETIIFVGFQRGYWDIKVMTMLSVEAKQ